MPFIAEIREAVRSEIEARRVIDVDAMCRRFEAAFPHLTHHELQDVILDAVSAYGGVASWGTDQG